MPMLWVLCASVGQLLIESRTHFTPPAGQVYYVATATFDATNGVTCFQDWADAQKGKCLHLGLSGTTITPGAKVEFEAGLTTRISVAAFDSANAIVCFEVSAQGKCVHLSRSGTTIASNSVLVFENGAVDFISVATFGATDAIVCYQSPAAQGQCLQIGLSSMLVAAAAVELFEGPTTTDVDVATFVAANGVVCYRSVAGVGISGGYCVHIEISSAFAPSNLNVGAPVAYCGGTCDTQLISVATFDPSNAIVCFTDTGTGGAGYCFHMGLTGTTLTPHSPATGGTYAAFNLGDDTDFIQVATFDSITASVCFTGAGDSDHGKCVRFSHDGSAI
jgi:hypothetical protein